MTTIELVPEGAAGTHPEAATVIEWPTTPGSTATMQADIGWDLAEIGEVGVTARDLLRVIACAYLADRTTRRSNLLLRRDLSIVVHVEKPDQWSQPALDVTADLLHWLTGDRWSIHIAAAEPPHDHRETTTAPAVNTVQLLSGGLDSFCGALLQMRHDDHVVYIGHRDQSKAVRHAQNLIEPAVRKSGADYLRWALRPTITVKEPTPRTRSLLFIALGVAVADARGALRLIMPENGFTSINPPLEPSRGGPLTTRSTHPWTFHQLARLLAELRLTHVDVSNPFGSLTKGELLAVAIQPGNTDDVAFAAQTLSCAKPNAGRLKGGNANLNCGWCIACLVRRGAFLASGIQDQTQYLVNVLPQESRQRFLHYRRHDIAAWRYATHAGLDEHRILGSGMWPPNTDFEAVTEICKRGLEELRLVPDP